MKRETAVLISVITGILIGGFVPVTRLVTHILVGLYSSALIIGLLIFICFISDKAQKFFR